MKYLRAVAAEEKYGLSEDELNRLCDLRKISGRRIGAEWFVDENSLEDYLNQTKIETPVLDPQTSKTLVNLTAIILVVIVAGFTLAPRNFAALKAGERVVAQVLTEQPKEATLVAFEKVVARFNELGQDIVDIWFGTKEFSENIAPITQDNFAYFSNKVINNWKYFLMGSGQDSGQANVAITGFSEQTREALKQEIAAEIRRELGQSLPTAAPSQGSPNRGLVVVPSTGDVVSDQALKNDLQNMFSDQVQVNYDASGRSGIITPEFRSRTGPNFLFILAPIKQ